MAENKTFSHGVDMGSLKLKGMPERNATVGFITNRNEPCLMLSNPASRDRFPLPIDQWEDKRGNKRGLEIFLKNPTGYGRSGTDTFRRKIWGDQLVRGIPTNGGGVSFRVFAEDGNGDMVAKFDLTGEEVQIVLEDFEYLRIRRAKHPKYFAPEPVKAAQATPGQVTNGVVNHTETPPAETTAQTEEEPVGSETETA